MEWNTSASNKNVAVSDQSRAATIIVRPPWLHLSDSIFVNGQGPAMQEARALRNSLPAPASRDTELIAAFHLPSGEHGRCFLQGTLPWFSISNALATLPTLKSLWVLME